MLITITQDFDSGAFNPTGSGVDDLEVTINPHKGVNGGTAEATRQLIEQYGADHVVPWITDRLRMSSNMGEPLSIEDYEQFIGMVADSGVTWFLVHPGGGDAVPVSEQQVIVDALRKAGE
jgi:hypothetical protein